MTGNGHVLSGFALSLATYTFTNDINGIGYIAAIGTILGAKAPDYLEIRTKVKDANKKVSLNLWKSGKMEFLIVLVILLFSLEYSNIIQFNWLEAKKLFANVFSNQVNI